VRVAHDVVLVVDFGAQYAQLIARRVREANVYSEIVQNTITAADIRKRAPKAIIFSGGPASVHVANAPSIDPAVYETGIPIFGICYGVQLIAQQLGGSVANTGKGEYGRTAVTLSVNASSSALLGEVPVDFNVWMSHFDSIQDLPAGFVATASTPGIPVAAMENVDSKIYGVQFHPEVMHSEHGQDILKHFLYNVAGCTPDWTNASIIDEQIAKIRTQVGTQKVMCALSGGVDSAVAAAMVYKAVGEQLTCVYVDTGLMRANESAQIEETFVRNFGVPPVTDSSAHWKTFPIPNGNAKSSANRSFACSKKKPANSPQKAPSFWCKGPSILMSSNPVAGTLQRLRATITSAAFLMTWTSNCANRSEPCSKTKFARLGLSLDCRMKSFGVSHSRALDLGYASLEQSPKRG
jgi:GMP synthase (glutamine-hydrolysing) A subunit